MDEEQLFYYKDKDSNSYLIAKHELDESEIGNYVQITENEYLEANKEHTTNKEKSTIQINRSRIAKLKSLLRESDYQAIKYAEGWISDEDYLPIKTLRQNYRNEINQLEQEIEDAQ